ncbi:MAG: VPS10 domain-containing protein [Pirellulaceae bacterium]
MRWIHTSLLLSLSLLASGVPAIESALMAQATQSEQPSTGETRPQGGGESSGGERLGPPEGAVRGPRRGGQGRGGAGRGNGARAGGAGQNTQAVSLPEKWIESLQWRSIGPANMSGRITALAVYEKDPTQWWAASASGGLLKTINNGVSFTFQFQQEGSISIGDVQVFQGDPNILWVGTGEGNPRNSSSWGDGVYRSTDGGATWKNVGLSKTFQIGRIALHPTDPNVAYVGALGRLWGDNPERGLFKTTDAGATWTQVLAIDDQTGVIDVQMHPADPQTLLVATYQRRRDGFDGNAPAQKYGPGSGIYRTTDGGANWEKLIDGLPSNPMGRIGLQYSRKDPSTVYAIIETSRIGQWPIDASYAGLRGTDADTGAKITEVTKDGPAQRGGLEVGDTVVRVAGEPVLSYSQFLEAMRKIPAQQQVALEVARAGKLVPLSLTMELRPELAEIAAAKTKPAEGYVDPDESVDRRGSPFAQSLGGQNPNMQDQQGAQSHEYGGEVQCPLSGLSSYRIIQ